MKIGPDDMTKGMKPKGIEKGQDAYLMSKFSGLDQAVNTEFKTSSGSQNCTLFVEPFTQLKIRRRPTDGLRVWHTSEHLQSFLRID
jgi:hypothetical protein